MANPNDNLDPDKQINPDLWTEKELLKHLYRSLNEMKKELNFFRRDIDQHVENLEGKINEIQERILVIETGQVNKSKSFEKKIAIWGIIIGILGVAVACGVYFF